MQRAYDQVIHDVALQNLHVVFCLDRGGLVGADGPTHHGVFDLAFMRNIPNMVVAAPMDEPDLRNMMYTASEKHVGPFTIRYPRGTGNTINWRNEFEEVPVGKGRKLRSGDDIAILSIGAIGVQAQNAIDILEKKKVSVAHYDMRYVKPLDDVLLHEVFGRFKSVFTLEDGTIQGGFGSAVIEWMADQGYRSTRVTRLGIPDRWIEHGTQAELYAECGYDVDSIVSLVEEEVERINAEENTLGKGAQSA
jgi:1-deoxy-D-xylulose-5-phosphate synthase